MSVNPLLFLTNPFFGKDSLVQLVEHPDVNREGTAWELQTNHKAFEKSEALLFNTGFISRRFRVSVAFVPMLKKYYFSEAVSYYKPINDKP